MYLALLFINSPVKFLNPRTVYVGILKYVPILEFHLNLRSLLIENDVEILGDRLSISLDPILKLSSSALTPIDTSSLESIKLFETLETLKEKKWPINKYKNMQFGKMRN